MGKDYREGGDNFGETPITGTHKHAFSSRNCHTRATRTALCQQDRWAEQGYKERGAEGVAGSWEVDDNIAVSRENSGDCNILYSW